MNSFLHKLHDGQHGRLWHKLSMPQSLQSTHRYSSNTSVEVQNFYLFSYMYIFLLVLPCNLYDKCWQHQVHSVDSLPTICSLISCLSRSCRHHLPGFYLLSQPLIFLFGSSSRTCILYIYADMKWQDLHNLLFIHLIHDYRDFSSENIMNLIRVVWHLHFIHFIEGELLSRIGWIWCSQFQ